MRDPLPFAAPDISALAKTLSREIRALETPPGHVQLLNMLARAAGYRNYQAMKAQHDAGARLAAPAAAELVDHQLVERTARYFDAAGRLERWPSKVSQQRLCLWTLWSRLPAETDLTEREVNDRLKAAHLFGDHALLRRDMVDMGLLTRTRDGRVYRRVERPPPAEALALMRQAPAAPG
ncbi:MAG TPA: DUF2087 domain-containing protein [Caulobacter sp.]|nr:DUF2087 domain-containing protein [Caulobacter sp.]